MIDIGYYRLLSTIGLSIKLRGKNIALVLSLSVMIPCKHFWDKRISEKTLQKLKPWLI